MAFVRSLLFAIVFYTGSLIAVLSAFPVTPFGSAAVRRHSQGWARFHRRCARLILGIRTRIEGELPRGPVLIAAKHQSMYETVELILILDAPAVVMKRELTDMPLWGWVARRYGSVPVDRDGSASALRAMIAQARALTADGRQLVIFPEGTRVKPGETPPLRPGFAGLYRTLGLPVVPVALDSGRVVPRGFVKRSGVVTMRFGAPIPAGLPRAEIEARTHEAINLLERRFVGVARG